MKGYEIKFKDGSSITLDEEKGGRIKEAWLDGKRSTPFSSGEDAYLIGDIKRIETTTIQKRSSDMFPLPGQESVGNGCKGKRSIQLEISRRIMTEMGSDWKVAIRDQTMRETYRQEILSENDGNWCDYIGKTCVCNDEAAKENIKSWDDLFPSEGKL